MHTLYDHNESLKCAFGVPSEKFLVFTVHRNKIDLNPTKAKAIQHMGPPTTCNHFKV